MFLLGLRNITPKIGNPRTRRWHPIGMNDVTLEFRPNWENFFGRV